MASFTFVLNAFAVSGETSGGGNIYCAEYISLVDTIAVALLQVNDPAAIQKIHPKLDPNGLWEISSQVTCRAVDQITIPPSDVAYIEGTAIHAVSYRGENPRTELKADDWAQLNPEQKLELSVHELLVIAGIERSYFYKYTPKVMALVAKASTELRAMHIAGFGTKIQNNPDGSITIFQPVIDGVRVGQEHQRTFKNTRLCAQGNQSCWFENQPDGWALLNQGVAEGFCIYLGFSGLAESALAPQGTVAADATYANVSVAGISQGVKQKAAAVNRVTYFDSISCK